MARFSQRYGYSPVRDKIQLDGMDVQLRNSLWSALESHLWAHVHGTDFFGDSALSFPINERFKLLVTELWRDFFKFPLDTLSDNWVAVKKEIRTRFFNETWFWVYDFIEFVAQNYTDPEVSESFRTTANKFLEREMSGYRFVGDLITPIIDRSEIYEIESAMGGKEQAVSGQLKRSLELLSDRAAPDYRNSVKESISAVEGQVMSTLGTEKGTLGALLNQLDQQAPVHPALKEAFSKLYGYTSDASGIRHALMDDGREVTFEEAKFMLVVCSAFINYVRGTVST